MPEPVRFLALATLAALTLLAALVALAFAGVEGSAAAQTVILSAPQHSTIVH